MSAILVPSFFDLPDGFNKSHRHAHLTGALDDSRKGRSRTNPPPSPVSAKSSAAVFAMQQQQQQHKASSGGGGTGSLAMLLQSREHRKLDRSMSEPVAQPQLVQRTASGSGGTGSGPAQANSSRYKTELCRPFEENGTCKYGDKCQFAHGGHELRTLARHPKYKTELCRTFHTTGFCPYGPRCHFIHNSEESKKSLLTSLQRPGETGPSAAPRPKALSVGSFSLGSAGELSPPSSLSASPTSLHSFFSDDPFHSPAGPQQACTAFSFSQDFAAALAKAGPGFGGSQPALGIRLLEDREVFLLDSPPSPVDSLSSDLDGLSLGGPAGNSPVSCASPLALLGPRLPIFSRLATSDSE